MKITAQFLILLAFIGGVLNYGKNYQSVNVSVVFSNISNSAKVERKKQEIRGRILLHARPKTTQAAVMAAEVSAPTALVEESQIAIATQVRQVFAADPETAVAVFRAESGLRPSAMGWNCYYAGVSRACETADRGSAWSVDCGVAQINVTGQTCPPELFDPQVNLEKAKEKFSRRGWQPWSAYNRGSYLAFLK